MISGAFVAGLISTSGLVSYALDKWLGLSGNWALLFGGVALIVTLILNPEGVAGRELQEGATAAAQEGSPARRRGGTGSRGVAVSAAGSFPSPYEIETPPGCEGWEEMYPYYALFDERRRDTDEERFWFWNSMHFPLPMPAFDVCCIDAPYQGIASWQNRVFAVPPAMGIDYRCVNGYVYISGNPVTDPAKIAERAEIFQERAGYYFANWDELYAKWKLKMEALIADIESIAVPELLEYEPDEVIFDDDRQTDLLRGARRLRPRAALRRPDVAAPLRVPAARLRRLPRRSPSSARRACPTSPTSTSRRWSPASTCSSSGRTPSCAGWRGWRSTPAWTPPSPRAARRTRSTPSSAESDAGRAWLAELEKIKDPWFNMATGDGLYHYYGSWLRRPADPVRVARRLRARAQAPARTSSARPRSSRRERDRLAEEYGALLDDEARAGLRRAARPLAPRLPVRRGAQVPLRLLVPDALVEQGARVRRPARGARLPRGRRGRLPALPPRGAVGARRAAADLGHRRRGARPEALAADRRAPQGAARAARRLDAAARARHDARGGHRPDGSCSGASRPSASSEWAAARTAGRSSAAPPASPGVVEGPARVVMTSARSPTCATATSSSARSRLRPGRRSSRT